MSFANPFRKELQEDRAREHFESHVLIMSPMHIEGRQERAAKAGITRAALEEQMFQEWYADKKTRGFANFTDGAAYDPGY